MVEEGRLRDVLGLGRIIGGCRASDAEEGLELAKELYHSLDVTEEYAAIPYSRIRTFAPTGRTKFLDNWTASDFVHYFHVLSRLKWGNASPEMDKRRHPSQAKILMKSMTNEEIRKVIGNLVLNSSAVYTKYRLKGSKIPQFGLLASMWKHFLSDVEKGGTVTSTHRVSGIQEDTSDPDNLWGL